jgi:uncharacterized membrane protein
VCGYRSGMLAATPRWERLLVLAPVFVAGAGLVLGVLILLGRALADSLRDVKHKSWIVVAGLALVGAIVLLTYLGISLPKEE